MLAASLAVNAAESPIAAGQLTGVPAPLARWPEVEKTQSEFVRMRDGIRLSTDIYRPRGAPGALPTILVRTPYDKSNDALQQRARQFATHGFAVVVQDHRGKFESEGEFFPYQGIDGRDGYDSIEWIRHQRWSNGRVGTYGCSYLGETQHMLARERHPNHTAAIAQAGSSYGGDGVRNFGFQRYGMTELTSAGSWMFRHGTHVYYGPPPDIDRAAWFSSAWAHRYSVRPKASADELNGDAYDKLPIVDLLDSIGAAPNEWRNWLAKPPSDPYWRRQGTITAADRFNVPTLHMNGWYDITPTSTLELFRLFRENADSKRAADNQYLIMYAGTHCDFDYQPTARVGDRPVGDARLDPFPIYIAWFRHWLAGEQNGITQRLPKVLSYALGANEWRMHERWPPANSRDVKWHLSSDGDARSRFGTGTLSLRDATRSGVDKYIYDPAAPVETLGGGICCTGPNVKSGAVDQRPIEARADVLVYTSTPLTAPLEVAGRVRARLTLSADVKDTDLIARLTDVHPDGTSFNVTEGALRLRYRDGLDREVMMQAGTIYHVELELESTHNVFLPGHRLRLHITSSSSPRFDRNLNTGGRNYDESLGKVATLAIHHGPAARSYLLLPTVQ